MTESYPAAAMPAAAPAATTAERAPVVPDRRRFMGGAARAGVGAVALGMPMIARADVITLRLQSTWPAKDIFHEFAGDLAGRVNALAGGRLKIELLPAGAVVRAFDLLDAVSKGILDGGHGVLAYWYPKNSAVALWGSGPAFGMDPNMVLAWHHYGGGRQLLEEIYQGLGMNVQSFVYGPMPTQPLGWFRKPIRAPEELKGLKYRTVGLAVDLFTEMGAAVNPLPSPEIVPALERGAIDAAEFNNASSDRTLGFPAVVRNCMLQSFHQASENFEVLFNRARFDALPADLRAVVETAVQAASADMSWKAIERFSSDYLALRDTDKVQFYKTPDPVLRAQLVAWDKVVERKSDENPMFRKVLESMRAFAGRACRWQNDTLVDYRMAYNYYFGRPAGGPVRKG